MRKFFLTGLLFISGLGYTDGKEDSYSYEPAGTFEQRKEVAAAFIRDNSTKDGLYGIFNQLAVVGTGAKPDEREIRKALQTIRLNRDCNDFIVNGLVRLMYVDQTENIFSKELKKDIEACLLDFKYWWDDGRRDSTYCCYHTENHQALYHTAELLAGQLYKNKTFTNGMTGMQKIQHATERLEKWLDYRFRFGFSEWLSSYYDVDVMLLANLYDYAEDETLRIRAGMVLDLLMFDMALNNFHGMMGSTSGRIYASSLIEGVHAMSSVSKLVFGTGKYTPGNTMGVTALCLSSYRCPEIISRIAADDKNTWINKQKTSLNVEDAHLYGLSYDEEMDIHLYWGMQEFIHPQVVKMSKQLSEKYDTWPYKDYDHYIKRYDKQIEEHSRIVNPHLDRFALSEANIITFHTPAYMLSSVQDYRKGAIGYQQHIWQATLGPEALVFTNSPGSKNLRNSPNYWAGNTYMPRTAQYENVVISIYNIPEHAGPDFTHAYFPVDAFDEYVKKDNWIFARKGEGYISLYSCRPTELKRDDNGIRNDLYAPGRKNIWICEMGLKTDWKSFDNFISAIMKSRINNGQLTIEYHSPSQGNLRFGWDNGFSRQGKEIPLRFDYRYDNPFCRSLFNSHQIEIENGTQKLFLDFEKGTRRIEK